MLLNRVGYLQTSKEATPVLRALMGPLWGCSQSQSTTRDCPSFRENRLSLNAFETVTALYACKLNHFSHVWLFVTPRTRFSLSMRFSRQEYWSGLPCPPPGDLPDPGIEPRSLMSPALAAGSLPLAPPGKPVTTEVNIYWVFASMEHFTTLCEGKWNANVLVQLRKQWLEL